MLARLTVASLLASLLKQALKGFSRVQLSAADSAYVRHVHDVMNIGCYKIQTSSVIQKASTTVSF